MPYITMKARKEIDLGRRPQNAGELNYHLTVEILYYLGIPKGKTPHYTDYNEVMGVLECVKQEFYRRKVAPYEQGKCELNEDVF